MARMSYAEQLTHPKWQRRRLEVLDRAGFRCERCLDDETTLHVHHKTYRKGALAWEYEDHELVVLCEDCHTDEHRGPSIDGLAALVAGCLEKAARDDRWVREQRRLYFENVDPDFERRRVDMLAALDARFPR